MSNVSTYAIQQLAATGFAIINHVAAMTLRPDLWPNAGMVCRGEFGQARNQANRLNIQGAKVFMASIEGIGQVDILARCPDDLAQRVWLILGVPVEMLPTLTDPLPTPAVPAVDRGNKNLERMEKLRGLAAQELPGHDCSLKRGILAARAELASLEPVNVEDNEPDAEGDSQETAIERAKQIILDMLETGPTKAAGILTVAEADSIGERTLQRAADVLGVVKSKAGFDAGWVWALPEA
jgi:hypothetical protein